MESAAIAHGQGEQRACGVIHISGEEAVATAEQVRERRGPQRMRRRTLVRTAPCWMGAVRVIDDILAVVFPRPTVIPEKTWVNCSATARRWCWKKEYEALFAAGRRGRARPGEFKTGFLKWPYGSDCSQAVIDLIDAETVPGSS